MLLLNFYFKLNLTNESLFRQFCLICDLNSCTSTRWIQEKLCVLQLFLFVGHKYSLCRNELDAKPVLLSLSKGAEEKEVRKGTCVNMLSNKDLGFAQRKYPNWGRGRWHSCANSSRSQLQRHFLRLRPKRLIFTCAAASVIELQSLIPMFMMPPSSRVCSPQRC